ncbi:MAG: hydantoinase B/oxoprolinase family protein [Halobacteriales archaeon]|nr:hydantoinase B/oxoprolinase family protein [Halobacteriales archaeon]
MAGTDVDAATAEVVRNYLTSAAGEMQRTLIRTAYNTIIYEILDFGLSIYDADLRLIADSPGLSVFLGANDYAIERGVEYLDEAALEPGDVILLNYPYWSSEHLLDALLFAPVFYEETLIGFTACRAHWLDLGAKDPGYVLDSTDVHQEGVIFPCTKVHKGGSPDEEILDIIRFNSRYPEKVMGDLNAQIAALRTGEERLQALYDRYGSAVIEACLDRILDHSRQQARTAVDELPDGSWSAVDYADGTDQTDGTLRLEAAVTIDGTDFEVDFSGSADQVQAPLNVPPGGAETIAKLCFKSVTTPAEDSNHGQYAPLSVTAPEGSIFNAEYPAATFLGWTSILGIDVIYRALAKGMPERVPAAGGGDLCSIMLYGTDRAGRQFVEANNDAVGWGATHSRDGSNALMHISETRVRNIPIEVIETKAPVRIERLTLRQDSGGAGAQRGGLGVRRDYRATDTVGALSIVQKTRTTNWGLDGGKPGDRNVVVLDVADEAIGDRIEVLVDNNDLHTGPGTHVGLFRGELLPGETVSNRTAGGGGYGDPHDRNPEAVYQDVRNGYVSAATARDVYGVVIEDGELDREKTRALRREEDG